MQQKSVKDMAIRKLDGLQTEEKVIVLAYMVGMKAGGRLQEERKKQCASCDGE